MNTSKLGSWASLGVLACALLLISCEHESSTGGQSGDANELVNVTGTWSDVAGDGSQTTITLIQLDSNVSGTFVAASGWTGTIAGRVNGSSINLTYVYSDGYVVKNSATMSGGVMRGTFQSADGAQLGTWTATRLPDTQPDIPESEPESEPDPGPVSTTLSFSQVPLSQTLDYAETVVVRTEEEWHDYLTRANQGWLFYPDLDPSDSSCDFSQNMLIAHSFGRVDGCGLNAIDVTQLAMENGIIRMYISVNDSDHPASPDQYGNFLTCDSISYPGIAVCTSKSDLSVEVVVSYY